MWMDSKTSQLSTSFDILKLVVLEPKFVDSSDAFESINILHLVIVEPKIVDSWDVFESINILQLVVLEMDGLKDITAIDWLYLD
jgi:hypothetical protein